MKSAVVILGSTGSIGNSTLDVISRHPEKYEVVALTANTDVAAMLKQCLQWQPRFAVMCNETAAQQLQDDLYTTSPKLAESTEVLSGVEGLNQVASLDDVDIVVAGIVGAAGLLPTLSAAESGKKILLANKEALVMSGQLLMDTVKQHSSILLPVDSEHNAIFQCMPEGCLDRHDKMGVNRVMLTASGGPFRGWSQEQLKSVTPEQAVAHPNWDMGRKISVDSATLMNKGLEVIEARWLFDVNIGDIQVVVHPQSVIHSMVSYVDGSVLAQLGNPDMRTPIAHALSWPERINSGVEPLDLFEVASLEFEKPDYNNFPCLDLCFEAMRTGGSASIVLNAANEVAVEAFLEERVSFDSIPRLIEGTLENQALDQDVSTIENILAIDKDAREMTDQLLTEYLN